MTTDTQRVCLEEAREDLFKRLTQMHLVDAAIEGERETDGDRMASLQDVRRAARGELLASADKYRSAARTVYASR